MQSSEQLKRRAHRWWCVFHYHHVFTIHTGLLTVTAACLTALHAVCRISAALPGFSRFLVNLRVDSAAISSSEQSHFKAWWFQLRSELALAPNMSCVYTHTHAHTQTDRHSRTRFTHRSKEDACELRLTSALTDSKTELPVTAFELKYSFRTSVEQITDLGWCFYFEGQKHKDPPRVRWTWHAKGGRWFPQRCECVSLPWSLIQCALWDVLQNICMSSPDNHIHVHNAQHQSDNSVLNLISTGYFRLYTTTIVSCIHHASQGDLWNVSFTSIVQSRPWRDVAAFTVEVWCGKLTGQRRRTAVGNGTEMLKQSYSPIASPLSCEMDRGG